MSFIKEDNIGKISFIGSIIIVVLLSTLLGSIFIHDKYNHFQKNLLRVEKSHTAVQRERLQSDVKMQIQRIDSWRTGSERNLKDSIKKRAYEAHAIAQNLYQKNKDHKSLEEIQFGIIEALRPVRFNNDRGYVFIRSTQGDSVLYPPDPGREGLNVYLSTHPDRIELFKKMVNITQGVGEGFVKYQWPKPGGNESERFEKITYVKHCEPFDWVIGIGEYVVDVEEKIQQNIIHQLNSIVPDVNSSDYTFIYQLHDMNGGDEFATMLVNPNRLDLLGKKISDDYTDAKGNMFRKEMLQGIRDKSEAFVTYWYKQPGSEALVAKLSYFKYYPEWNWIVAKGTYLDHLDRRIAEMQTGLRQETKSTIRHLLYFVITTCILFLGIGYLFSKGIHRLFAGYKTIQKEQQEELERVNAALTIQATTDSLTHLYNRVYFNKHLEIEIFRSQRHGSSLSLFIFDIDKFKQINDTFGHLSGDDILKDLSQLCQTNIRSTDILARWGGEEFVVLAPESDTKKTTIFAEKLRKQIEEHPFSIAQKVTCSFGVTQYREGEDRDTFINRADEGLYEAKAGGRNKVVSL